MISDHKCKKCCINQIYKLAKLLKVNEEEVLNLFKKYLKKEPKKTAPEYARFIFEAFEKKTGILDPYEKIKKESNKEAMRLSPVIKNKINFNHNNLKNLIDLSIIGNMIDYGAFKNIDIEKFLTEALSSKFFKYDIEKFEDSINKAKTILYISDNAGEIIFDIQFLKYLKSKNKEIILSAREKPIINDVTYKEAKELGLEKFSKIISTGARIPGIVKSEMSKEFLDYFYGVDLVIAKGQGNFETIFVEKEKPKNLFYLFIVKCEPVATTLKAQIKDKVLMKAK
jgi:damage-control phosphatase, subfamily I